MTAAGARSAGASGAFLTAAAGLAIGAAVHLAALAGGPRWMAWLGAPPGVVTSRQAGTWLAPVGTLAIAALLLALGACSVAAARTSRPSPALRAVLSLAATVFILRAALAVPLLIAGPHGLATPIGSVRMAGQSFVAGSMAVFVIGLSLASGLWQARGSRPIMAGPCVAIEGARARR